MRMSIFLAAAAIASGVAMAGMLPASAADVASVHPQAKPVAGRHASRSDVHRHDGAWSYGTWRGLRQRERVRAYARVVPPGYYRPRAYFGTQRYLPPQPLPPGWERPHIPGEWDPGPFRDYR